MSIEALCHDDWLLASSTDAEIDEVMTWFPDAGAVYTWGGPKFRFPFTAKSFREDCHIDTMESYSLRNESGKLAAFGQSYERDGRGHLARLVANPYLRRQGAGRQLISMMIASLERMHDYDEFSLFVFRDNVPAYECYLSLGFVVQDYPDNAPMLDKCYFLTRKTRRRE
jgi:ribosomal protein S18 acetylase RimI-like enzyme